ncbi:DUF835 domain-containing protein [Thermococcus sp.]|uniref:DUF835 domain-containing protein n=1 Tax=Thermococcus sp. TaxID=35749 RepID=UPI002638BDA2|nr:DUF835 domain-containing protein [Thermococcus sp.]
MSGEVVYLFNVLSRATLLLVAGYKSYRERSAEWIYMTLAFTLATFDPERFLLAPLGFHLHPDVAFVLDLVNTLSQGILAMVAAVYVKEKSPPPEKTAFPVLLGLVAYLWVVGTNAVELNLSFAIKTSVPLFVYSIGYFYLGYTIFRYSLPENVYSRIFSISMMSLGILNATYPFTVSLDWFRPYGFAFGTLFRLTMALGALGVAFWPVERLHGSSGENVTPGTLLLTSPGKDLLRLLSGLRGAILVTRSDLRDLESFLDPSAMVFWVTRATEGELRKSPHIYAISPTRLGILLDLITRALDSGYRMVYIDSVEYLILENNFRTVLKFLADLKDRAITRGARVVIMIDPTTLDEKQVRILEREFGEIKDRVSL